MKDHRARKIYIYAGRMGLLSRKQWRASLIGKNGSDVLFVSGEGYNNRNELVELCQDVFPGVDIVHLDPRSVVG